MADVPQLPGTELSQAVPSQICCSRGRRLEARASLHWDNNSCTQRISSDGAEAKFQSRARLAHTDTVHQRRGRDGLELWKLFYKGWVGWDVAF